MGVLAVKSINIFDSVRSRYQVKIIEQTVVQSLNFRITGRYQVIVKVP